MSLKAINLKMNENKISDIKSVASTYHMTMTDVINEALDEYLTNVKSDPYFKLTANIKEASSEESKEILEAINNLSDDDLKIVQVKKFKY